MRDFAPFKNRLQKNVRHFAKWARRQQIECYRVYDRDIPEFPVAIDRYGERLHIAEYDTGWQISEAEHAAWVQQVVATACEVLALEAANVAFKTRRRQRGLEQYEKLADEGTFFVVHENGLKFWVNLDQYLDTGLFLDHRPTRARVRAESRGLRVLNLFSYTGSFTVYAAAGGAARTTTVDLSNTYLDWARRNLALNGFDVSEQHRLIRADVLTWLQQANEIFDLMVIDPPSFSNSKKMHDIFDVQRDHVRVIDDAMRWLSPDGTVYFSNNRRGFILSEALKARYRIEDISAQSVPEDFRNRRIHQCFRIQHA